MTEPVYMELPPELRRNPSEDEMWLKRELDRIDPDRNEMGNAGDGEALRKLVLEMRGQMPSSDHTLKVKRLHPDAVIPAYHTAGAACFDLVAIDDGSPHPTDQHALIFRTGLAFEVPPGWALEIHSRSGQGFNHAVRLSNCTGEIDSDYRGEVMVSLRYDGDNFIRFPIDKINKGDRRIAQAKLVRAPRFKIVEVDQLSETARGTGGFGSTGA